MGHGYSSGGVPWGDTAGGAATVNARKAPGQGRIEDDTAYVHLAALRGSYVAGIWRA